MSAVMPKLAGVTADVESVGVVEASRSGVGSSVNSGRASACACRASS